MSQAKWPEIDWLRGTACIFMILNHAGVAWLDVTQEAGVAASFLTRLGSYAPVVFFFVTGLGYGVRRPTMGRPVPASAYTKIAVLLLADQLLNWWAGRFPVGLDFLGFIGLSAAILEWLTRRRRATAIALGLLVSCIGLRYGLGSAAIMKLIGASSDSWLALVLGRAVLPNVSYTILPWLSYPLAGYLLASWTRRSGDSQRLSGSPTRARLLWVVVPLSGTLTMALLGHGASFFRWGTMSLAFFVSSIALLALGLGLADLLARRSPAPRLANLLAIRGVASLAVVPIHYVVVFFVLLLAPMATGAAHWSGGAYLILLIPVIGAVWTLSRIAAGWTTEWGQLRTQRVALRIAPALAICGAGIVLWIAPPHAQLLRVCAMAVGQLGLGLWLVAPRRPPLPANTNSGA
ncbi:MAG: heparan-alpha-glucosaminide N-acetyltransferase domain-containing protein [Nannocystaceae bacterium]